MTLRNKMAFTVTQVILSALVLGSTASAAKTTLNVWQPWGGTLGAGMAQIARAYEKSHPNVKINMVQVDNSLATNTKFFASMAAGKPPEVIFLTDHRSFNGP